ncbi:hypothetical protein B1748_09120 [Paenibacillus sp. MY03]|nr:hypothetical protein B1748_09120 [Paenibacillus sp. MY03]
MSGKNKGLARASKLNMMFLESLISEMGGRFKIIHKFAYAFNSHGKSFLIKINPLDHEFYVLNRELVPVQIFDNYSELKDWVLSGCK